eukprot:8915839-Pyramimonas_sp.AAC.1
MAKQKEALQSLKTSITFEGMPTWEDPRCMRPAADDDDPFSDSADKGRRPSVDGSKRRRPCKVCFNITSFFTGPHASNSKDALNTPDVNNSKGALNTPPLTAADSRCTDTYQH